jgi:MSHA biogenesis protein MshL
VREADSVVRAKSGQIVVIGGLMRSDVSQQEFGVPGLKDVPLVGNLFKHRRDVERKSELVILLKPIVVNDDAVWDELAREPTLGRSR